MAAPDGTADEGRRARARRATLSALHDAAMEEIREHGAVDLSLRRVARRMGMSPAGLYRYVASRDDLLTRLIADAYHDLADHLLRALAADDECLGDGPAPAVRVGPAGGVADRMEAAALAYREWAVAHPHEFGLLFGDPVPNYAAPPGGETVAAMGRVGVGLGRPLREAFEAGRLRIPPAADIVAQDPAVAARLGPLTTFDGAEVPPGFGALLLMAWGRLHGQVSLEVFGHHRWLFPDGCEALYRAEVAALGDDLLADVSSAAG